MNDLLHRSLAVGLLAVLLFSALAFGFAPVIGDVSEGLAEIALKQGRLDRYATLLLTQTASDSEAGDERVDALRALLIEAESPALVQARLQELVASAANLTGVAVNNTETLAPRALGSFIQTSVRINLTADNARLGAFLRELEASATFLRIDDAAIRSDGASRANRAPRLTASLTISAFALGRDREGIS